MIDPRRFLKNSDFPMDKIILMLQGIVELPANGGEVAIAHKLPFAPLCLGSWSLSSDFTTAYDFGYFLYAPATLTQVVAYADATNIRLASPSFRALTAFYRIYGFAPSDYNGDVAIPNVATGYRINSDYNYMKLFDEDAKTLEPGASQRVNHELGYKPSVFVWKQNQNGIFKHAADDFDPTFGQEVSITDTQLILKNTDIATQKYHYRIYCDD